MTAQIPDEVSYRRRIYDLTAIDGEGLFDPEAYGLQTVSWSSACWRGYTLRYAVRRRKLLLDRFSVSLVDPAANPEDESALMTPPSIEGRTPTSCRQQVPGYCSCDYTAMALPIPFTGGLLIGWDFIPELYVHMGFHPAWKFREVHELLFEEGRLIEGIDRSAQMEAIRARGKDPDPPPGVHSPREHMEWIERSFSRDYFPEF